MYQRLVIATYEHNVYIALYMNIVLMFDKWLKTVLIGSMFDKWLKTVLIGSKKTISDFNLKYENVYKIHTHT